MVNNDLLIRLNEDLKNAMKSGDKNRLDTVRMLKAGWQKIVIEKQENITPDDELSFFQIEAKRRKEAIEQFIKGGRQELADKENLELAIISEYMPKPLTDDELSRIIDETIEMVNPQSQKDIGKIMSALMPKIKGKADGKKAQELVKSKTEKRFAL
jgi:hypothetical protein